jgi:hypothetical protein
MDALAWGNMDMSGINEHEHEHEHEHELQSTHNPQTQDPEPRTQMVAGGSLDPRRREREKDTCQKVGTPPKSRWWLKKTDHQRNSGEFNAESIVVLRPNPAPPFPFLLACKRISVRSKKFTRPSILTGPIINHLD